MFYRPGPGGCHVCCVVVEGFGEQREGGGTIESFDVNRIFPKTPPSAAATRRLQGGRGRVYQHAISQKARRELALVEYWFRLEV